MPVVPALGGKLNSTVAILRSARSDRRSATSLATRAASFAARSGFGTMSREQFTPSQPAQRSAGTSEAPQRPPKVIGQMPPSSSGIATIIVASTGNRPRGSDFHCRVVWNSSGWAVI